ncbi:hypothetical protein COU60_00070 [Candidatus Pacearchaeota archaeon CG10_big_fil_rev_8_21_14_0_10_34_76]|nr:MAG: hypothetical protein COU60_00070 [Candidatus Pacearchaeota archaeon CG10_big_fil_rev_8_21_14_0_10_34_76]
MSSVKYARTSEEVAGYIQAYVELGNRLANAREALRSGEGLVEKVGELRIWKEVVLETVPLGIREALKKDILVDADEFISKHDPRYKGLREE